MASLVESVKYGAINTTDTTTNEFYVIMFTSEAYTLQYNTTIDGKIATARKLVAKAQYICSMQLDTNWYCIKHPQQYFSTVSTRKLIHPLLEVNAVINFHAIPKILCNRTQDKQSISRHPICLTDSDHDYTLEEIGRLDKIEFEIDVEVYNHDKEN